MTVYSSSKDYERLKQLLDAWNEVLVFIDGKPSFLRRTAFLVYRTNRRTVYTLSSEDSFRDFCEEEKISFPEPPIFT